MLNNSVSNDSKVSKLGSAQHCHTSNQTKKKLTESVELSSRNNTTSFTSDLNILS